MILGHDGGGRLKGPEIDLPCSLVEIACMEPLRAPDRFPSAACSFDLIVVHPQRRAWKTTCSPPSFGPWQTPFLLNRESVLTESSKPLSVTFLFFTPRDGTLSRRKL